MRRNVGTLNFLLEKCGSENMRVSIKWMIWWYPHFRKHPLFRPGTSHLKVMNLGDSHHSVFWASSSSPVGHMSLESCQKKMGPFGGFYKWRYPKMVGLCGKIPLKWMMTGGPPISGNHQLSISIEFHGIWMGFHRDVDGICDLGSLCCNNDRRCFQQ